MENSIIILAWSRDVSSSLPPIPPPYLPPIPRFSLPPILRTFLPSIPRPYLPPDAVPCSLPPITRPSLPPIPRPSLPSILWPPSFFFFVPTFPLFPSLASSLSFPSSLPPVYSWSLPLSYSSSLPTLSPFFPHTPLPPLDLSPLILKFSLASSASPPYPTF